MGYSNRDNLNLETCNQIHELLARAQQVAEGNLRGKIRTSSMTKKIMIQHTKKSKLMKQMAKFMIMKKQMAKREKITTISMPRPLLHRHRKSATAIPDDVIIEILVKLPARSVGRFRCVCKSWLSTTTNLPFIRVHTQHNRITRQSLIIPRPKPRMKYYLASADANTDVNITLRRLPGRKHKIVASCDGLLYLRTIDDNYIVNPLTGYSIKLPTPGDKCNVILGFYFHHSTSKYRVLRDGGNKEKETFVCVVGEKSWRRIPCLLPAFYHDGFLLDLKGSLYWLAFKEPFSFMQPNTIMTFDKESEVYGLLSLPPLEKQHNFGGSLVEVNEELGLLIMGNDNILDVWIKEESWVKRYSVNYIDVNRCSDSLGDLPEDLWYQGAAVVVRNEELLVDLIVSTTHYHLIRCNLKSGACCYHRSKASHKCNFHSLPYVEALAYPDCSFT